MKTRIQMLDYFKEITIVVLGVWIAIAAGNYKESLDNQAYLKKTLAAIENEITISQGEIDTVLSRHLGLYEKLAEELGQSEQSLGEFISSSGGFQVANIKNISLRFFVSNKAELLSFEVISQLLDIESRTKMLNDKVDRLANFTYDNVNETDPQAIMKFAYLLSDVIEIEQSLLESYSGFLEKNEVGLAEKNE